MALTQAQIRHIANLSRLTIDESSLPKYEKDLNAIVGYVDILNKVNPDELASINTKE
jgi:aspartyl/glutamyl-tRNA(Asn/Gln) amidotransferase C subunit